MRHRSIHQGPVLRIASFEAVLVAAVSLVAIAVITGPAMQVGPFLDRQVAILQASAR